MLLSINEVSTLLAKDFERYTSVGSPIFHSYGVLCNEVSSLRFDDEVSINTKPSWSDLGGVFDGVSAISALGLHHEEHSLQKGCDVDMVSSCSSNFETRFDAFADPSYDDVVDGLFSENGYFHSGSSSLTNLFLESDCEEVATSGESDWMSKSDIDELVSDSFSSS